MTGAGGSQCPQCETVLAEGSRFCHLCGTLLNTQQKAAANVPAQLEHGQTTQSNVSCDKKGDVGSQSKNSNGGRKDVQPPIQTSKDVAKQESIKVSDNGQSESCLKRTVVQGSEGDAEENNDTLQENSYMMQGKSAKMSECIATMPESKSGVEDEILGNKRAAENVNDSPQGKNAKMQKCNDGMQGNKSMEEKLDIKLHGNQSKVERVSDAKQSIRDGTQEKTKALQDNSVVPQKVDSPMQGKLNETEGSEGIRYSVALESIESAKGEEEVVQEKDNATRGKVVATKANRNNAAENIDVIKERSDAMEGEDNAVQVRVDSLKEKRDREQKGNDVMQGDMVGEQRGCKLMQENENCGHVEAELQRQINSSNSILSTGKQETLLSQAEQFHGEEGDEMHDQAEYNDSDSDENISSQQGKQLSNNKKKSKNQSKSKMDRQKKQERKQRREESKRSGDPLGAQAAKDSNASDENTNFAKVRKASMSDLESGKDTKSNNEKQAGLVKDHTDVAKAPKATMSDLKAEKETAPISEKEAVPAQDHQEVPQRKTRSQTNKANHEKILKGTGDSNELEVHFYALLDPAFGDAENLFIVMGYPISNWSKGPRIPVEAIGRFEELIILHGKMFIPSFYREDQLIVPYKYAKVDRDLFIHEFISRPHVQGIGQGYVNRCLFVLASDWQGKFNKFDGIVSPRCDKSFLDHFKFWKIIPNSLSEKLQNKDQFILCVQAFNDVLTSQSNFGALKSLIRGVYFQLVCDGNGKNRKLKFEPNSMESYQIFEELFKNDIEENYKMLQGTKKWQNSFLASISVLVMFPFSNIASVPTGSHPLLQKLLECLSLKRLYHDGYSPEDLKMQLESEFGNSLVQDLVKFIKLVLDHRELLGSTAAYWSLFSIISLLDPDYSIQNILGTRRYRIEKSFENNGQNLNEINAALHFSPKLKKMMMSFFNLKNHEFYLSMPDIDYFDLLTTLKNHLPEKHWIQQSEIEKINILLTVLLSRVEINAPKDPKRISSGIDVCSTLFTSNCLSIKFSENMEFYSCLLNLLQAFTKEAASEPGILENVLKTFEKRIAELLTWIRMELFSITTVRFSKISKFMDLFFKLPLAIDCMKKFLDDKVEDAMQFFIEKEAKSSSIGHEGVFEVICSVNEETTSPQMIKLFHNTAINFIDSSQEINSHHLIRLFMNKGSFRFLWRLCDKELATVNDGFSMLRKLLCWPPSLALIKLLIGNMSKKEAEYSGEGKLKAALDHFRLFESQLFSGEVIPKVLEVICNKREEFCKISNALKMVPSGGNEHQDNVDIMIVLREKEWKEFTFWKKKASILVQMCEKPRGLEVELMELKAALERNTESIPLSKLCTSENGVVTVTYFRLPSNILKVFGAICYASSSTIFNRTWEECGQNLGDLTLEQVAEELYKPVTRKLIKTVDSLLEESITLSKLKQFLKDFTKCQESKEIVKELKILLSVLVDEDGAMMEYSKDEIELIADKIVQFFKLNNNVDKAAKVIKLGEAFGLQGNFEIFKDVQEKALINMKETQLTSLNQTHFSAANAMRNVDDSMEECIDCILRSMNLITWLRDKLKSVRDVKTFVELLSISAGESDYEADRVSCLHTVCLELEPIIFQLDLQWGPVKLVECFKGILDKTAKDPTLLKKLTDSNRYLEWFKREHESYGSVAKSCMIEAEAANTRGYYVIGCSEQNFDIQTTVVTLENSLRLRVPQEPNEDGSEDVNSEACFKEYNLDEIGDLQSKLVLIGGKVKEREIGQFQKDDFLKVFESMTRVANLYVDLCNYGCYPYLSWRKRFDCSSAADSLFGPDRTYLHIEEQCKELEKDLQEWQLKLHQKRWEFPPLNCFTVRQLMFLQKELKDVLIKEDINVLRNLPAQVFTLLEEIHPEINQDIFTNVLYKSSYDRRYGKQKSENGNWQKVHREEDRFFGIAFATLERFVEELEKEGHDEDVAKAATFHCGITERAKASAWAFDNADDEKKIEELASKMTALMEEKEAQGSNSSHMDEQSDEAPEISLEEHEENSDFLKIDEIGKFMVALANYRKKKTRKLQIIETMKRKHPSLMVVPKDDLLCIIIDIYRQACDRLPLPKEVVICNSTTSHEKIELLLRRALLDPDSIYTVAFIDELDYNVSEQAFKTLTQLLQERVEKGMGDANYNLLLMCASEKEDGSYLASAWDEYRIVAHRCPSQEETRKFLFSQFKYVSATSGRDSPYAAAADEDSSTVRVVKSYEAGAGKSFCIKKVGDKLGEILKKSKVASNRIFRSVDTEPIITTSLQGTIVDQDDVVKELLPFDKKKNDAFPRIFHFDIASSMQNLDRFIFELLILGSLSTTTGSVWKKKPADLYMLETTESVFQREGDANTETATKKVRSNIGIIIPLLPTTLCPAPEETLEFLKGGQNIKPGFDSEEFESDSYQRVYQYLNQFTSRPTLLEHFLFKAKDDPGSQRECLEVLLRYCGVDHPSWRQLCHFVHFFNSQLYDCETSVFCNPSLVGDTMPGFRKFVIKFMLMMSKDFATPSVDAASQPQQGSLVSLRRTWERSEHPYLFFNQDHVSVSFLGFIVNSNGDLLDKLNRNVIERRIMSKQLLEGLKLNGVDLSSSFDNWSRQKKLEMLCSVTGVKVVYDPDQTYELTMDNVMKILAINMRFRSGIPVIIMGETGCGKTRLIRFMCRLKAGRSDLQNMVLVKVHGGVTENDIKKKVQKAMELAQANRAKRRDLETVLFFDEANTTTAIGMIKEIMCDMRMGGKPLDMASCGLQVIAACNPYRKHTDDMIAKLESAGLGYRVKAEDATEKLGKIPLRQLVYRVHRLPDSMLPLVWDFGQLSPEAEILYTMQIVNRYARKGEIPNDRAFLDVVAHTLGASQLFMREQKNECSFVSLRDVERAVQVLAWFYSKMPEFLPLIKETKNKLLHVDEKEDDTDNESDDDFFDEEENNAEMVILSLSLALTVCYAVRLEKRDRYYRQVARHFTGEYRLINGYKELMDDAYYCQQMFLDELQLGENIAKNTALSENIFMMVVCIELRIPLFVVGKPGSSKSLAKTIIQDNMQGKLSHSDLFKKFKQILMCSYQCSPLSTADGIIATFRQCSRFQEGKELDTFASVVVLDEVGLAEDSPRMPLKALHPLLEDGTDGSEDLTVEGAESKAKRVAFIGISNWALDPAKMNRGLMLTRGQPNEKELVTSADGICNSDLLIKQTISGLFPPLAKAYLRIYKEQTKCVKLKQSKKEEFFGLRDYYCLIKMIFNKAKKAQRLPTLIEIEHAVKRNFGGLEDFDTWEYFRQELKGYRLPLREGNDDHANEKVDISPVGLLRSYLQPDYTKKDTRYLLLMTENYAALRVLEKVFPEENDGASVIFGSSFPKDQEFTQVCRDINKIKVCMETGMTVILLNMENLYESLYDALNQYYVYLGGQRYVDLGLGSHRVKCRVHEEFKLIVVAEKSTVYDCFPIPLINRLEKHFLVISTCLSDRQIQLCEVISQWAADFSIINHERKQYYLGDAFVGYNSDTSASVLLETMHKCGEDTSDNHILEDSKKKLLAVATPESVARLNKTPLRQDAEYFSEVYYNEQSHSSFCSFLKTVLMQAGDAELSVQVTTFSRLLSPRDQNVLNETLEHAYDLKCISLNKFQTEQQFSEELRRFVNEHLPKKKLLIVQCSNGDENSDLIASARHLCRQSKNLHGKDSNFLLHIVFIVNLKRVAKGCRNLGSFHGVNWLSVHIDELRPPNDDLPSLVQFAGKKLSFMFQPLLENESQSDKTTEDHLSTQREESEHDKGDSRKMFSLQLGLLRRCIQASCVRTNDDIYSASRVTKRIHILTEILSQDCPIDPKLAREFACILLKIIYKVLSYKESQAIEQKDWFLDEAVTGHNIQECGTFRRALSYRIEKEIVPILSHIINHIDKNCNLDILLDEKNQDLWLNLFACEEFMSLDYEVMFLKQPKPDLPSLNLRELVNWVPFSIAIKEKISSFIKEHQETTGNSKNVLQKVLEHTSYGHHLLQLSPRSLKAYLRDLVYIEYDVNEEEHELVAMSIFARASKERGNNKAAVDIIDMHLVSSCAVFQQRMQCLLLLSKQMPKEEFLALGRMVSDAEDVIVDVICLKQSIERFYPEIEHLLDQQMRFIWCKDVQALRLPTDQIFHLFDSKPEEFITVAKDVFEDARVKWTRLLLIKEFVEHICPAGKASSTKDVEVALELWEALQYINDDLSSASSWIFLKEQLQILSSRWERSLDSKLEDILECIVCEEPLEDRIQFPCLHVTCFKCAHQWLVKDGKETCLVCQARVPVEFKIKEHKKKNEVIYELGNFRKRCVGFFMEAVSIFCFSSENAVRNEEIIEFMITLVTTAKHQTKQLSPFPDFGIDQTPTVRSFLIQQLLKAKDLSSQSEHYLQCYLANEAYLLSVDDVSARLELCLLLVQCYEDFRLAGFSKTQSDDVLLEQLCSRLERVRKMCSSYLPVSNVQSLQTIADLRATITNVAEVTYNDIIENSFGSNFKQTLHKLYTLLKDICLEESSNNLKKFFMRQLLRRFGIAVLRKILATEDFKWLESNEDEELTNVSPDRFILYGDEYRRIREEIGEAVMRESVDNLELHPEEELSSPDTLRGALALLSVYREVTTSYSVRQKEPEKELLDKILECLKSKGLVQNENLAKLLLNNMQGNGFEKLKCTPFFDDQERQISEVVIHTMIVLSLKSATTPILQPLALISLRPQDMMNSFLPTMPDDHLTDVFDAAQGTWKTYYCPNGHPYIVTQCGMPVEKSICPVCKAEIGGIDHRPTAGNVEAERVDRTQTGHILGDPKQRLSFAVAERNLSTTSHSMLSVLLHSALLLGACNDPNSMADLIHPRIPSNVTQSFMWQHVCKSVQTLAKAIGRSIEEAVLAVHLVLESMLKEDYTGGSGLEDFGTIASKQCRFEWEDKFNMRFIQPRLASLTTLLEEEQQRIVKDNRIGAPLIRNLYEIDAMANEITIERNALDYQCFWRYRVPITVAHLKLSLGEFTATKGKSVCKILQEFLKKEDVLRFVKALPDIMLLQRILSNNLSRRIDSETAKTKKIKDIVKGYFKGELKETVNRLLKVYYTTWKALKPTLLSYGEILKIDDFELSSSSPIAYILPSLNNTGKRALLLLKCLAEAHNSLVNECRDVQGDKTELKRVSIQEANQFNLITYDYDKDLVPIMYAHCDYSLEIGKGTIVDYNFPALERQIVNTFISGKPVIDMAVTTVKYADDVNSLEKFEELERRVEQRDIPFMEQHKMASEIQSLPEVCDSLRATEITIGLLSTTGADSNVFFKKYLEDVLRMPADKFLTSAKMQSVCRLAHIRSIWIMLTVERAFRLHVSGEDPFDLKDMFREEVMDFDQQLLRHIDIEHLLAELTEYIVLEVPLRNESALDYPLQNCLEDFLDKKKTSNRNINGIDHLPETLCLMHIFSFWKVIADARKEPKN